MYIEETFTENQKKVYEIAKDYLQYHPHFTIDELYSACKKKSALTDYQILLILEKFIRKKIFVPGSRLTRTTVLNNKRRNEIVQHISANPGVNFNQIKTHCKLGSHACCWHLEILKKFGIIRERKFIIYNVYFPHNFPEEREFIVFLLRKPNIFKIYLCLKKHPLNPHALSKILDLDYSTINYHLLNLQQNKIIFAHDDNTSSINSEFVSFLEKYYDLTVPHDFTEKIEEYLRRKNPVPPPLEEK